MRNHKNFPGGKIRDATGKLLKIPPFGILPPILGLSCPELPVCCAQLRPQKMVGALYTAHGMLFCQPLKIIWFFHKQG